MLSTRAIENVTDASHYYSQKDNYYTTEQGFAQSAWWGRGAQKLNLTGQIDSDTFTAFLAGKLPDGMQLGKVEGDSILHRPGWDLTLSPAKSFSILALIGKDKRLVEAHVQAVIVTLNYVERAFAEARVRTGDKMDYQKTANVVAALFLHDISRELDPQLHTHAVILNMTERLDGKWRSLASSMDRLGEKASGGVHGFYEQILQYKKFLGKIYQMELVHLTKALGYETYINPKTGRVEIEGVTLDVIEHFSKRRDQIETFLSENNLSGGKAASFATLSTRKAKQEVDREALWNTWVREAKALGFDADAVIKQSYQNLAQKDLGNVVEIKLDEINAIKNAIKSLSQFQPTFPLHDLLMESVFMADYENYTLAGLTNAIQKEIQNGELIEITNEQGKTILMSKETKANESSLKESLQDNKKSAATLDSYLVENYLASEEIDEGLKDKLITFFNDERIILLEGNGQKDSFLKNAIKIAKAHDLKVALVSPNLVSSKLLGKKYFSPETIWEKVKALFVGNNDDNLSITQFISQITEKSIEVKNKLPDIVIVNQAQLLSTEQKAKIALWNKQNNKKLVLLTESDNLLAQKVSTNMEFIKSQGISSIKIMKGNDTSGEKKADIVIKMANQAIEVKDSSVRLKAMANHYSRLNELDRRETWLVAQNKQKVDQINILTHDALNNANKLGQAITFEILIPRYIADGKRSHSSTYHKNQMIRFNDDYKSLNITRGEYLKILSSHKKENCIMLEAHTGEIIKWQPDKLASNKVELFDVHTKTFQVSTRIVFHRSNKAKNIVKGEYFTINKVSKNTIQLLNQENKKITINLNKNDQKHFDYGYAATPHTITHLNAKCILAEMPAKAFATNQRTLSQIMAQSEQTLIYTDNHQDLANEILKKTGDKVAIETILNQSDTLRKNMHTLYDLIETRLKKEGKEENLSMRAIEAVQYAIHHLSEREAGFTHKNLLEVAMDHALGDVNLADLTQACLEIEKEGVLIKSQRDIGTLWTTLEAVQMEREIIKLAHIDKGKLDAIADVATIESYAQKNTLNKEQTEAVRYLLQNPDRVMAIQGRAGTGKTTMFATYKEIIDAKELIEHRGFEILGLAPTNVAAKELMSKGLPATTLDSFMVNIERERSLNPERTLKTKENLILILDEASMASNRKMLTALTVTHEIRARIILVGDTHQNPAVEAGKPQTLVHREVQPVELNENRRQNDPILKQAVSEIYANDYAKAFETLSECIIEINSPVKDTKDQNKEINRDARIAAMVDYYFSLRKEEHTDTALMVLGNDDRKIINEAVHKTRKELGELGGKAYEFDILLNENMTFIERSTIPNLKVGQFIRFSQYESKYIKAGDYHEIIAMNEKTRVFTLKSNEGKEIYWEMPTFDSKRMVTFEIFSKVRRELMVNDDIRWLRTDKKEQLLASEKAVVRKIDKDNVTVLLASKKELTFSAKNPKYQHWDYAYAATSYNLQGQDVAIGLGHMESNRKFLANKKAFLVLVTRVKDQLRIYTDDKKKLLNTIIGNPGEKLSSLEVIGEHKNIKKADTRKDHKVNDNLSKTNAQKVPNQQYSRFDLASIKENLRSQTEKIATDLLGKATMKSGDTIRFGQKGSLAIFIKGDKAGGFYDFEEGKGGDIFKLIEVYGHMKKKDAIFYGARLAGFDVTSPKPVSKGIISNPQHPEWDNKKLHFKKKNKIAFAQKLANQSQAIKGTIVQKYLELHRGIHMEKYPDDIRYHPGIYSKINGKSLPAMLVLARNKAGVVQAVQATYLDKENGNKFDKKTVNVVKQTFGNLQGATVNIGTLKGTTLITEGIENGLSLAASIPEANVKITLGKSNFKHLDAKNLTKDIIFCLDNDGKNLQNDMLILECANRLNRNKNIAFMVPNRLDSIKQDYNDIHLKIGKDAIREDYKNARSFDEFYGLNGSSTFPNLDEKSIDQLLKQMRKIPKESSITDADIARFLRKDQKELNTRIDTKTSIEAVEPPKKTTTTLNKNLHEITNIDREI